MTDPSEMIAWLDKRIASAEAWLNDHGRSSKHPRPDHEIMDKEYDVARLQEIRSAYFKALAKREKAA